MPRAVFAMFAMLAVSCSLCIGQKVSDAAANANSHSDAKIIPVVSSPTPFEDANAEQELLALVNQSRHEAGVSIGIRRECTLIYVHVKGKVSRGCPRKSESQRRRNGVNTKVVWGCGGGRWRPRQKTRGLRHC